MNPERIDRPEFADESALRQVFDAMNDWLVLHGQQTDTEAITFIDPDTNLTVYMGKDKYQIYDNESYEYKVSMSQLQEIAPAAKEILHVEDNLTIWYTPAHFDFDISTEQQNFVEPTCGVFYNLDESSAYKERIMSITLNMDSSGNIEYPEIYGEKHSYSPRTNRLALREISPVSAGDMVEKLIENLRLEHDSGEDQITKPECAALADILNGLLA